MASPIPAFGAAPLGNLFAPIPDDEAIALVRHAWERGVRYFDTAPHYGNGLSEHRVGMALRERPRESFTLSTKVGRLLTPEPNAPRDQQGYVNVRPFVQRWDYSRDGTLRSIEDSLQRLGLARIDCVFIHDVAGARTLHLNYAPAPSGIIARVAAIEDLCLEYRVSLKAAAPDFPLSHPAVDRVLAGARSRAELDENLALAAQPIAPAFWRELRVRGMVAASAPLPGGA